MLPAKFFRSIDCLGITEKGIVDESKLIDDLAKSFLERIISEQIEAIGALSFELISGLR